MRKSCLKFVLLFCSFCLYSAAGSVTLECPGELKKGQEVLWLRDGHEITDDIGEVKRERMELAKLLKVDPKILLL